MLFAFLIICVLGMGMVMLLGSACPSQNGWIHEDLRKSWNYTRDFSAASNKGIENIRP